MNIYNSHRYIQLFYKTIGNFMFLHIFIKSHNTDLFSVFVNMMSIKFFILTCIFMFISDVMLVCIHGIFSFCLYINYLFMAHGIFILFLYLTLLELLLNFEDNNYISIDILNCVLERSKTKQQI